MRKELEVISRREELEKELIRIRRELERIHNRCEHEVVVITEYCQNPTGNESYHEMKCLFCGMEDTQIASKRFIDVSKERIYGSNQQMFEIVKRLFIKCAEENPNKNLNSIVELVKYKIFSKDEDFCKIAKELRVPFVRTI
ncbi:MAG: hypothetical protein IJ223_05650 [Clostridia bacterium]|nr:hypothetical protein [Clostridia bacterium]